MSNNKNPSISAYRIGCDVYAEPSDGRSAYEMDSDRILFSDGFRALSDKTQVHGTTGNDFIRSRLTHSLEVSRVGRTLGVRAAPMLREAGLRQDGVLNADGQKIDDGSFRDSDIGHIVAAACLMHDIGNPPFGHTGEEIISGFFRDDKFGRNLVEGTSEIFRMEACHFEGNAQGFRVVTRLQGWRPEGGLGLTAATLAAFGKYPFSADPSKGLDDKKHKYGFYMSDAKAFQMVTEKTQMVLNGREMSWKRHPLAYLLEAADDICYQIVDIEDACDLGIITLVEAEELLMPIVQPNMNEYRGLNNQRQKLFYLRGKAINKLVDSVIQTARGCVKEMFDGTYKGDVLFASEYGEKVRVISNFAKKYIYANPNRQAQDLEAGNVLKVILKETSAALLEREKAGGPIRSRALATMTNLDRVPYDREGWIRALCDHVSSMTDSAAVYEAKRLS